MESISFVQWIGSIGGVGAVFGLLMFFLLRDTSRTARQDRKYMEDRMSGILNDYNKATLENTKILYELFTYLKMKNGNKS